MLALIMSAMILSTQAPPVNSGPNPQNRNRRMQYGKSKVVLQPFMCKPASLETADIGPVPAAKSVIRSVDDGIKRVRVFESGSDKTRNPIEVLAELNRLRIGSSTAASSATQNSTKISDDSNNKAQNPVKPPTQEQQQQEPPKKAWQRPATKSSSGLANIYWRAVDVEDLRAHPYFDSLPLPDDVCAQNAVEYSLFRQDSWQWGALHSGRLTTARAAACLGFYEKESSNVLKVPRSLSGHSKELPPDSWDFLNQDYATKHPEEFKLINNEGEGMNLVGEIGKKARGYKSRSEVNTRAMKKINQKTSDVWIKVKAKNNTKNNNKNNDRIMKEEIDQKIVNENTKVETKTNITVGSKEALSATSSKSAMPLQSNSSLGCFPFTYRPRGKRSGERGYSSASQARMAWGSSQEATAVLVAVNYFQKHGIKVVVDGAESHTVVAEAGMFPFEALTDPIPSDPIGSKLLLDWVRDGTLPLIGASPDGMLRHPDGSCEVLEVKCHSPFMENRPYYNNNNNNNNSNNNNNGNSGSQSRGQLNNGVKEGLSISDRGPADSVATWHIPQLQLHILCAGPKCTGAVLVSLSATKGATIFRVQRDDKYIMQMMTWIRQFYVTYVLSPKTKKNGIPENYFLKENGYAEFLNSTLKICQNSIVVSNVDNADVQRSPLNSNFFI